MAQGTGRHVGMLAGIALLVFGVVATILFQVMPLPRKDVDYLVVGAVSTLATMLAVFLALITTIFKDKNPFFNRRKRTQPPAS